MGIIDPIPIPDSHDLGGSSDPTISIPTRIPIRRALRTFPKEEINKNTKKDNKVNKIKYMYFLNVENVSKKQKNREIFSLFKSNTWQPEQGFPQGFPQGLWKTFFCLEFQVTVEKKTIFLRLKF